MTDAATTLPPPAGTLADAGTPIRGNPFASLYRLLALSLVAALVLVPLLATALGGFKSLGELRVNAFGLPQVWVWQNYWDILVPPELQSSAAWSNVSSPVSPCWRMHASVSLRTCSSPWTTVACANRPTPGTWPAPSSSTHRVRGWTSKAASSAPTICQLAATDAA